MPCPHLPNYLRTFRKRSGFSQDEIAFLLGGKLGAPVSHYEHFKRLPNLRTLLAFRVIFRVPITVLFRGEFKKVEKAVCRRAKSLAERLVMTNPDQLTARKLALLEKIIKMGQGHHEA